MGADRPGEASKLFEARFGAGDIDGLMELYEDAAVFTNARGAHIGSKAIREVLAVDDIQIAATITEATTT
ncbi:hypothetical protein ACFLQ7_00615, partial [Actinomycetota bacterium]